MVVGQENDMALDLSDEHKNTRIRVDVNLTVYLKLWLPLEKNKGGPIFQKVMVTLDLVEMRHKSIRLPNNTIRNPTIFFIFLIFLIYLGALNK